MAATAARLAGTLLIEYVSPLMGLRMAVSVVDGKLHYSGQHSEYKIGAGTLPPSSGEKFSSRHIRQRFNPITKRYMLTAIHHITARQCRIRFRKPL